jgi:hypothetical protein
MGETGQTPGVFLRGGGTDFFSGDCAKALEACGLSTEDFGTYDQVKGKLRSAKSRMLEHRLTTERASAEGKQAPPKPGARDRFLASSQAGHLRQNALFQRKRGNSCQNEPPGSGHPGALCYHSDLAPCAPHPGASHDAGTTHWAQGQLEKGIRKGPDGKNREPGAPVSNTEIKQYTEKTAALTAHGSTEQALQGQPEAAQRVRDDEAKLREECAAELKKTNASKVQGPAEPQGETAKGSNAQKCIESYIELATKAMRQQVMNDYSEENYDKTKDHLQGQQEQAKAKALAASKRVKAANEKLKSSPNDLDCKEELARAKMESGWAWQDYNQAKKANESAKCLKKQASELRKNGGSLTDISGSVPGWGRGKAQRAPCDEATGAEETY